MRSSTGAVLSLIGAAAAWLAPVGALSAAEACGEVVTVETHDRTEPDTADDMRQPGIVAHDREAARRQGIHEDARDLVAVTAGVVEQKHYVRGL